jgi:hypothetical protein
MYEIAVCAMDLDQIETGAVGTSCCLSKGRDHAANVGLGHRDRRVPALIVGDG